MADEVFLAETERWFNDHGDVTCCGYGSDLLVRIPTLIEEVRRLRTALQLSESSRGIPVTVGRD